MTATVPASLGSLTAFREPASVAVVGASSDTSKWGYWLAAGALAGRHRRRVYLVNRRRTEVGGVPTLGSIAELPEAPELVVLCTPAEHVETVVEEALARGSRGFIGITAGLDQVTGRPGAERELATRIRAAGARLLGPNCLGLYDAESELQLAWGTFEPGSLGIVSQSGQLGSELADLAAEAGLGVSRFVSIGNQADISVEEAVADLVDHESTRVVAIYIESFRDGRAMIRTLRRLRHAGKPAVLLTVGGSEASRTAARSHTGALTSSLDVVDAACRAAGTVRVQTPAQLIDVAQALVDLPALPRGGRVVVVGDSGGQGAVAADVATARGLTVSPLGDDARTRLAAQLPGGAAVSNPVDLAGAGEQDLDNYAAVVETVSGDPDVDAVVLTGYFGSYAAHTPHLAGREATAARRIAATAHRTGKPVLVHSMCASSSTVDVLRATGVPTYRTIDATLTALGATVELAGRAGRDLAVPPETPQPVAAGYWAAREALLARGIAYPPGALVRTPDELEAALRTVPGPYVLKADWLEHKSDFGGVLLGLATADDVRAAYTEGVRRLRRPTWVLEQLDGRPHVVELIVGARRDPTFGPVVLIGAGGTEAELHRDGAVELAPLDVSTARGMLQRLRCAPLLAGWRGRPAVDIDAIVRTAVGLGDLLAATPEWAAVELNPLRVDHTGALAVDALVTTTQGASPSAPAGANNPGEQTRARIL
ncbi:acetate--CoA ligase family protein [Egicoccus sp. AB-alg2]|uniref:acetate--CoA ligase family protein n=1 Tax=Egicoccus sp. AB-alg2 TaxID=3242693 RepID=UPI00359EBFBB